MLPAFLLSFFERSHVLRICTVPVISSHFATKNELPALQWIHHHIDRFCIARTLPSVFIPYFVPDRARRSRLLVRLVLPFVATPLIPTNELLRRSHTAHGSGTLGNSPMRGRTSLFCLSSFLSASAQWSCDRLPEIAQGLSFAVRAGFLPHRTVPFHGASTYAPL